MDQISAYHERLAICAPSGDVSESEAHRIATEEAGCSLDVLADRLAGYWRDRIATLPAAPGLDALRSALTLIIVEPWVAEAARCGWDGAAVFGVHPHAPLVRVECWGVATWLALSPHARQGAGGQRLTRLAAIEEGRAAIVTPTGARFSIARFNSGFDQAIPVWDAPAFSAPTKH